MQRCVYNVHPYRANSGCHLIFGSVEWPALSPAVGSGARRWMADCSYAVVVVQGGAAVWCWMVNLHSGAAGWWLETKLVREECVRQRNKVAIILGIIYLTPPLSGLSALSRLGLWLADDFKGKPPHWLLGVNSYWSELSASTSLMSYGDGTIFVDARQT